MKLGQMLPHTTVPPRGRHYPDLCPQPKQRFLGHMNPPDEGLTGTTVNSVSEVLWASLWGTCLGEAGGGFVEYIQSLT